MEKIRAAAIRIMPMGYRKDVEVISLSPPARHSDIFDYCIKQDIQITQAECGFATSIHRFVDRIEAYKIAVMAGQIEGDVDIPDRLTSEMLW